MTTDREHTHQAARPAPLFHIVLHEPEIPNNTGNIGRTCVATGCSLHLIHPLGFDTSAKACRRAGLDYWPRLDVTEHLSVDAFMRHQSPRRLWLFSTRSSRSVFDAAFEPGDYMLFGKETAGLPASLLDAHPDHTLSFPMLAQERSLNLATAVCAAAYEGIRQLITKRLVLVRTDGRFELPSAKTAQSGTRLVHKW
ncbi:MAG: tRNA (cytidine(34)-2'-O)-methyltransferase [Phycisphaerales bacterium]|nr:tRNA (cytidine(34)-2'-O)-methyltransferase [Phycisphaerales bacterium]